jgi:serine protease inhibitor
VESTAARKDERTSPASRAADNTPLPRRRRWTWTLALAASLLVVLGAVAAWSVFRPDRLFVEAPGGAPQDDTPQDDTPRDNPPGDSREAPLTLAGWQLRPVGGARFEVLDPHRVRLDRGELRLIAVQTQTSAAANARNPAAAPHAAAPQATLHIDTPAGRAAAAAGDFLIGVHPPTTEGGPQMSTITRVLVLAGMITLTNTLGEVRGQPAELLTSRDDRAPTAELVRGNSQFAWDLYHRLAAAHPGENLFFSPYSISTALAMAAEGARGETAREMGDVLHFPAAARRIGGDAQLIPWKTSLFHTGMAQLQAELTAQQSDEARQIRDRLAALRARLDDANTRTEEHAKNRRRTEALAAYREAQGIADEINELLPQVDQYQLTLANALWVDKTFPLDPVYLRTIDEAYGVGAFPADFKHDSETARQEINQWTRQKTGGLIREGVPPGAILPTTRLVLANAVHFLGQWEEPFSPRATRPRPFTLAGGEEIELPQMKDLKRHAWYGAFHADGSPFDTPRMVRIDNSDLDIRYPGEDGFLIAQIPYRGGTLSMVLIAPQRHDRLAALEEKLSAEGVERWLKNLEQRDVRIVMPRFAASGDYGLSGPLQRLGMERAFSIGDADFSGVTTSTNPDDRLYLSAVVHKAEIRVNEEGTEAAAATYALKEAEAQPLEALRPFTPEFTADRPFLFVIRHHATGAILFAGRIHRPESLP